MKDKSTFDMCLVIGGIVLAALVAIFIKKILYTLKRPNGKKGGILSLHVAITFAAVTGIGIITKDIFITSVCGVLAYLVARGRMDENQHYTYQVALSSIIGVLSPLAIVYFFSRDTLSIGRMDFADKPANAVDDRHEADAASDLRLD